MEKEMSMRDYYHLIQNELNKSGNTAEDIEDALVRLRVLLKDQPGALEILDETIPKMKKVRNSMMVATDAISKIKIPSYLLGDADLTLEQLEEKIKEKFHNITIHVVEDDLGQCKWYKAVLEKKGFQVSFSHTFLDAIKYVTLNVPYIVILDLHAPTDVNKGSFVQMYADEVIETIEKESKGTRVVVVSSEQDPQILHRMEGFKSVVRTIPKPPTVAKLEAALSIALLKTAR